jgi:decaprenylphospho-beta-D-ribofuranose 2-oxidase
MPIPEAAERPPTRAVTDPLVAPTLVTVAGWGGSHAVRAELLEPDASQAAALVARRARVRTDGSSPEMIARGMGRSYGDAAQRDGGIVLGTRRMDGFALNPETGRLHAAAGATLGQILATVVPRGWMLPVVPGTQQVSVGGAIASDVHGKNQATAGTFSRSLLSLDLLTGTGEVLKLGHSDEVFWATVGGMGLTGLILSAQIQLVRVGGPLMSVDIDRVDDLDAACAALRAPGGEYRVAWLDLVSSTRGRGFVTRAHHLPGGSYTANRAAPAAVAARLEVPRGWPTGILRPSSVRVFNLLRYRVTPRRARGRVEALGAHLFPLDVLANWPRLYGPRGFLQYQLVVPPGREQAMRDVVDLLHRHRMPPFLVVLKDFGAATSGGLSFPIAGWTLALDLPRSYDDLDRVLDRCDEVVAQAGGRVYLSKDSRMRPGVLEHMYPELERWRQVRATVDPDGLWRSDLALRTRLLGNAR